MIKSILAGAAAVAMLAACDNTPQYEETNLNTGVVRVYDFGQYKLHNYATKDVMDDQAYVLETPSNLIGIEGPAFEQNVIEWRDYISTLNKPLEAIFTPYHPNGGGWQADAQNYATAAAIESRTSGAIYNTIMGLSAGFGDIFPTALIPVNGVIENGAQTIAGTELVVNDNDGGYTIEFPAIKVLYLHMLGADTHSILGSVEHIDSMIAELEEYKKKDYALIITSHHAPESAAALDAKIAYLKQAKKIAAQSSNAEEFIAKMKAAFPKYAGENYLEMSAGNLFK